MGKVSLKQVSSLDLIKISKTSGQSCFSIPYFKSGIKSDNNNITSGHKSQIMQQKCVFLADLANAHESTLKNKTHESALLNLRWDLLLSNAVLSKNN